MKIKTSIARGLSAIALSVVALSFTVFTQTTDQAAKLISLPKLQPRPKTERHLFGTKMTVTVAVDAKGKVTSVNAIDGPGWICPGVDMPEIAILREAAKAVAMKAKFEPATVDGKKVDSFGVLDIEFPTVIKPIRIGDVDTAGTVPMRENVKTMQGTTGEVSDNTGIAGLGAGNGEPTRVTILGRRDVEVGAAPDPKLADRSVSGGVLNGKALQLPKPTYPKAARAVRASGAVSIQVLIGEGGTVVSAEPISGHPLLRSSARSAACGGRFTPTLLEGKPVNVSGVITYNFVP